MMKVLQLDKGVLGAADGTTEEVVVMPSA